MPRHLYARQFTETVAAGHSLKVFSEKVDPRYILRIDACFFHVPESQINDVLMIYMENGGQDTIMVSEVVETAKNGLKLPTPLTIGEGDRIYGYSASADVGDSLVLSIAGKLIPVDEWRNYQN